MKLPPFNISEASWDRFHAFYIDRGPDPSWGSNKPIVQFDTGEVIITPHNWTPDDRGKLGELNIGVFRFADHGCPTVTTPDGELLPTAHLDHHRNRSSVVVDYDTGHVVSLHRREKDTRVPVRLRQAAMCYFSGEDQEPVGGPIWQSKPRRLEKCEKDHLRGLLEASKAWVKLLDKPGKMYGHAVAHTDLLDKSFEDVSENDRTLISAFGIEVTRELVEHAYLLIK